MTRLLLKIDWFILSYCSLMYFTNYLDRSNVANAYVSGMRQDLHMLGDDYNKLNTIFTCGYIVGMIPNNLMLQVVPPRAWLPAMHITWGVLTFCSSAVKNIQQLYAIRFLQGLSEASTFVGTHYILGAWYKPTELGKRSGIFTSSGLAGTLFSGVLQAAVYQHLNGRAGRSGWRWLFIIDGVITLPIALYGILLFPDTPATSTAFYLTKEERAEAVARLGRPGPGARRGLSWGLARRVLGRWRWYGCSLLFAVSGELESFGSNNLMGLWLASVGGYTVEQVDYYPCGVTAVGIASTLLCAAATDAAPRLRWAPLLWMCAALAASAAVLLATGGSTRSTGAVFFAYYLAGAAYTGQATTFAWANEICADDDQERAVVLASMNMMNNAVNAWWPLLFYRADAAPRFAAGTRAMLGVCGATLVVVAGVWAMWWREGRARARAQVGGGEDGEDAGGDVGEEKEKEGIDGAVEVGEKY